MKKGGAWFSYNDMRIGQGRENSKKYLLENPDIMNELEEKIRENADSIEIEDDDDGSETVVKAEEVSAPAAEEEKVPAAKKTSKKSKIMIEADEDFEEFSMDELE